MDGQKLLRIQSSGGREGLGQVTRCGVLKVITFCPLGIDDNIITFGLRSDGPLKVGGMAKIDDFLGSDEADEQAYDLSLIHI